MSLDTYANVIQEIADHLDRNDLAAKIPTFITAFEDVANSELPLRTRFNTATTTLSLTSASPLVSLPADFLEAKTFIDVTSSPVNVVPVYTPASLYAAINTPNVAGNPKGVTIVGSSAEFQPTADTSYSIKLYYYQKVTALSSGVNWLLTNFPSLYLYGPLVSAEAYLGDDPRLKTWGDLYDNLIQKLAGSNERGQYGGTPLTVRVDAGV